MALYSQSCGYAILALKSLNREKPLTAAAIADRYGVSVGSIAQALFRLKRAAIVDGKRGKNGGFTLSERADKLSLYDLIVAMGCERDLPPCMFGLREGVANYDCPTWSFWKEERQRIEDTLKKLHVADLEFGLGTCPARSLDVDTVSKNSRHALTAPP